MSERASILIVDDDADMCRTLLDILEDKGYSVVIAEDGSRALAEARSRHFDLALIDITMPGMNGVETLRGIKSAHPGITTMIMTTATITISTAAMNMAMTVNMIITIPIPTPRRSINRATRLAFPMHTRFRPPAPLRSALC